MVYISYVFTHNLSNSQTCSVDINKYYLLPKSDIFICLWYQRKYVSKYLYALNHALRIYLIWPEKYVNLGY